MSTSEHEGRLKVSHGSSSEEMVTQILHSGRLKDIHKQSRASDTHLAKFPRGSKVSSTGEGNSPLGHKAFGALTRQSKVCKFNWGTWHKSRFNNSALCLKYVPSCPCRHQSKLVAWEPTSNLDIWCIFKPPLPKHQLLQPIIKQDQWPEGKLQGVLNPKHRLHRALGPSSTHWNWMILKVPSNPNDSVLFSNSDSVTL